MLKTEFSMFSSLHWLTFGVYWSTEGNNCGIEYFLMEILERNFNNDPCYVVAIAYCSSRSLHVRVFFTTTVLFLQFLVLVSFTRAIRLECGTEGVYVWWMGSTQAIESQKEEDRIQILPLVNSNSALVATSHGAGSAVLDLRACLLWPSPDAAKHFFLETLTKVSCEVTFPIPSEISRVERIFSEKFQRKHYHTLLLLIISEILWIFILSHVLGTRSFGVCRSWSCYDHYVYILCTWWFHRAGSWLRICFWCSVLQGTGTFNKANFQQIFVG